MIPGAVRKTRRSSRQRKDEGGFRGDIKTSLRVVSRASSRASRDALRLWRSLNPRRCGILRVQRCMKYLRHFCIFVKSYLLAGRTGVPVCRRDSLAGGTEGWSTGGILELESDAKSGDLSFVYICAYNDVFIERFLLCPVGVMSAMARLNSSSRSGESS